MSLFDVIKYGNTDLGSEAELLALPKHITEKYHCEVYRITTPITDWSDLQRGISVLGLTFAFRNKTRVGLEETFRKVLEEL